jgi:beta-phosphoglucomutase-like phosphatase (HAD superfamily)
MVKAVIFDMDGTLIDSVDQHARAWQDAFQDFGHEFELKAIRAQIGKGGDQLLPVFLTREEIELKGRDLEKHRGNVLKERYLFQIKPFPKVTELFHRIRADNIKIVLASSAKAQELRAYEKIAGIEALIDVETSSDDAEQSKPILIFSRLPSLSLALSPSRKSLLSATRPTMPRLLARPVCAR